MSNVFHLQNVRALEVPEIQELFKKAYPKGNLVVPRGFEEMPEAFIQMLLASNIAFFIGVEKGEHKALAHIVLPGDGVQVQPQIAHFYNEGSAKLRDNMIDAMINYFGEHGYAKVYAVNGSGKPDDVWLKSFRKAGPAKHVGSIMEFTVG